MKEINLKNKVLDHIDNVRDWLDRAEMDYQNGAGWQGELNLNLAQAELRKAWEESRRLNSTENLVPIPARQIDYRLVEKKRWARYRKLSRGWAGLAAAILIVILVSLTPFYSGGLNQNNRSVVDTAAGQNVGMQTDSVDQEVSMAMLAPNEQSDQVQFVAHDSHQINREAYTQISFSLDEKEAIYNPFKEVTAEKRSEIELPAIKIKSQPVQLVSSEITRSKSMEKEQAFNEGLFVNQSAGSATNSLQYDLDTLIQLAEDVLYVKK